MAGQKFTLTFDAQLNVSQMNGALKQIQSTLNGLHLPQNVTRGLQGGIDKLQKEITNFESLASKDITSKADMSKLETQAQKVSDAFSQLRHSFANLTGLNGKDLEKLFPSNISKNITDATKALNGYTKTLNDAKDAVRAQNTQVKDLKQSIADLQGKKTYTNTEWKQLQNDIKAAEAELEKYKQLKEQAEAKRDAKQAQLPATYKNSSIWRDAVKEVQNYESEIEQAQKKLDALNKAKVTGIKQEDQIKGLQKLNAELTTEEQKLQQLVQVLQNLSSKNQGGGLQQLIQQVGQLTGLDMTQFKQSTEGVGEAIRVYLNQQLQQLGVNLNNAANSVNNIDHVFANNRSQVRDCAEAYEQFNMQAREVEQLKSRIQYFFSLNNAILLVKRTLREAYQTIKELDKAMTETAVVTDFSVGDMWAQLPDYTARANELGVTTKAAYEAATLFYQQGLKTNEVIAMSNETLKMARIAGLDAAVATDRMTNAIRGFNMEINEINAQRIDDVYSRLAAISASNVDEISTAMTKVASLAHNANMEFETTAAFLAQIIETTRESAETAGTALKTVVARFSEVKKLVDEGELSGKDGEGEVIDVNKVSEALRTAGIDLNKYFLGEIGLDDIFIELASKWDSLTTIQQRYIATQAAGSRQQSRFIALMSDYARTQELVGEAYNANGAAAKQFAKTQESLESKLARLKNAWNEFAMGITNSNLVKAGVDLLTNILNGINALTSGFSQLNEGIGTTISSVSKLLMLFGVLGLGKTMLGGLTAGIANVGRAAAGQTLLNVPRAMATAAVGSNTTGALAGLANRGAGGALLAGFLNPLGGIANIGKTVWGGMKGIGRGIISNPGLIGDVGTKVASGLGTLGASSGTAAGIMGIATALGAVVVAVGLVVSGYQAWLHLTPEGQLKHAKQIAEVMNKTAANTQNAANEMKKARDQYKQYTDAVNNASTVEERNEAIQNRNEYINSLLEQNEAFAEYVNTEIKDGQLVLTVNDDDLNSAIDEITKHIKEAAMGADFANAMQAGKQADVYQAKIDSAGVSLKNRTIRVGWDEYGNEITRALTNAEYTRFEQYAQAAENARAEERSYAAQAYGRGLEDSGLEDDVATMLSNALAEGFNEDAYLDEIKQNRKETRWWKSGNTRTDLEAEYRRLYGTNPEQGMKMEALKQAIATQKAANSLGDKASNVAELFTGDKGDQYKALLQAYQGMGKMTEINLEELFANIDTADLSEAFGFDNLDDAELQAFANAVGIATGSVEGDIAALKDHIKTQVEANKKIQAQTRADIFETMMRNGMTITADQQALINGMAPEQVSQIKETALSAEGLLSAEDYQDLISGLINGTISQEFASELTTLFNSIDLNNPIGAFNELAKAKEEASKAGNQGLVDYIEKIQSANEELFTASNLVQSFITSNDYDEITESLDKFIEENGRISADNIEELAKESKLLKQLLDSDTVSTKALANALTLIQEGKINFEQLSDAMLIALDAGESFEELIENVSKWIKDFNPGTDLGEGADHVISILEDFSEYVSNWEFGNQPVENIYDQLFGEGAYETYLRANWGKKSYEQLEQELAGQAKTITTLFENNGLAALQGIDGLVDWISGDGLDFSFDLRWFSSTQEAIDGVRDSIEKLTGLKLDDNAIRALVEAWKTHMADLGWEWDELASREKIEAYIENLGDARIATEQNLIALGAAVDENGHISQEALQEVIDKINEVRTKAGKNPIEIPIIVNWQDKSGNSLTGDDLLNQYKEQFGSGEEITITRPLIYKGSYEGTRSYQGIDDAFRDLQQYIDAQTNSVDIDGIFENLASKGLSPAQAEEIASEFTSQLDGALLNRKIEIPVEMPDGSVGMVEKTITGADLSALEANINAELEAANAQLVANKLANANYQGLTTSVGTAVGNGVVNGATAGWNKFLENLAKAGPIHVPVDYYGPQAATGGMVRSFSSGSGDYFLQPGFALTGEEGPEIVWNKERGYAYITGQNGAEFQNLQPGDRVFNAAETSRIFRNSRFAKGGVFESFASGGWKEGSNGGGSDSGSDKYQKQSTWRNELDWLYDLMEDIAEYERQQNIIQARNELALKDIASSGRDLYKLTREELTNLETQLDGQQAAQLKRLQQMGELQTQVNAAGYGRYMQWNQQDQTLEIDWDAIEAIQDKETYDEVVDWLNRMESVQDQIDDAEDAMWDIKKQIQELQQRYLQKYLDFQNRVLDAIVKQYQDQIDKLSEINDNVNDTNASILDSIQREIDLERQIRDNTDAESNIADMEARLAYLQRDTTGANATEIRQLQKQLDEARTSYGDTLIDQAVDRLSQSNEDAAAQREKQIELMQAQLDYWQESGGLWSEVEQLISTGFNGNGSLIRGSDLEKVLQNAENYEAMSQAQRDNWANELILETNQVGAHILELANGMNVNAEQIRALLTNLTGRLGGTPVHSYTAEKAEEKYATGGLNTYTGLAHLDGTPSAPEYVLNPEQTNAFLRLADVLPSIMGGDSIGGTTYGGDIYLNLSMHVDEIASDYDVDRIADRVKDILYDASSYRNVNTLNFIR